MSLRIRLAKNHTPKKRFLIQNMQKQVLELKNLMIVKQVEKIAIYLKYQQVIQMSTKYSPIPSQILIN